MLRVLKSLEEGECTCAWWGWALGPTLVLRHLDRLVSGGVSVLLRGAAHPTVSLYDLTN